MDHPVKHQNMQALAAYQRQLCGTKRGDGSFLPYFNDSYFVYGPPIKTKFMCDACGHKWETTVWGGDRSKYCPQCGKQALKILSEEEDIEVFLATFNLNDSEQETEKGDDK